MKERGFKTDITFFIREENNEGALPVRQIVTHFAVWKRLI
jgi:hypothetical protein